MASNPLREITKTRLTRSQTRDSIVAASQLDDRSCAIVLSAMLDHGLEKLLLANMQPLTADRKGQLFSGFGPLATSSAKIRIAAAFDVIGPRAAHDLEALNDIRNTFAHAAQRLSFRNHRVRKRLSDIEAWRAASMMASIARMFETEWMRQLLPTLKGKYVTTALVYILAFDHALFPRRRSKQIASGILAR
jgi:hypothetical protein